MKKTITFLKLTCIILMLVLSTNVSAVTQTITITTASIGGAAVLGSNNYNSGAERVWTQSSVSFGGKAITGNPANTPASSSAGSYIQAQASNGVIYNTSPLPGRIVSITLNQSASVLSSCYGGSTSRLVNSTSANYTVTGGTQIGSTSATGWTSTDFSSTNYTYFAVKRSTTACYFSSIVIEYEVTPTISTPSPTTINGFSTTAGTASTSQTFTVGGSNLSANLVVTAPSDYEVRENGTGSFGSSVSFAPSLGTVATKTIEVRISASAGVGTPAGNVACTSTDATTKNVAVSGTVNAASSPVITASGTINAFANTVIDATSSEQSYTVQGSNLSDNIIITPPAGFQISKSSGSGFVSNPSALSFTPAEVSSAQNVYVRFAPTAVQAYSGNITHTSTGATPVDKALSGTGVKAEPSNHATSFTATANSSTQITVTWTDATGGQVPDGYLVKASTITPTAPSDGTAESDVTLVKNITQGIQTAVFTGLSSSTTYNFSIWPYTNSGSAIDYKIGSEPSASASTSAPVVTTATVTLRPSYIDLATATSESAVLVTLTNYSSNDVKYRLYNGSNQYYPWNEAIDTYVSSASYSDGPSVPGTPSSSSTYWILFQRGSNNSATASYRDRLGAAYSSNYQTVALPSATSISSGFTISGNFNGTPSYDRTVKYVVLAYNGSTLISASSTALSTGSYSLVCPTGTTIDKVEVRAIDNTLIVSSIGSWTTTINIGDLPVSTFTGTGDWSETARWNTGSVPTSTQSVIIDGNLTISSNIEVAGLTINSSRLITINSGKQLTVNSTLTNNGTINLKSDATGTATLNATVSGSGTANVEQYLTSGRNWYISSPVSNALSGVVTSTGGNSLWSYDEVNAVWNSISATDVALTKMYGFVAKPSADGVITFSGTLNPADNSLTVYRTENGKVKRGFNLVGNPYPSYVSWSAATKTNLMTSIWYRTKNGANSYVFDTYNASGGLSTALGTKVVTNLIPPMQAFWVRVAEGQTEGTVGFTSAMRAHKDDNNNLFKAPAAINKLLRMQVSNGVNSDESILYFNTGASDGFDNYDSPKMFNSTANIPEIYTTVGTEDLVINGMNTYSYGTLIPLGFNAGETNTYTISASQVQNFDADTKIILIDNQTSTQTDLTAGQTYTFTSDATTTTTRFSVLFKSASGTTGVNNSTDNLKIYTSDNKIMVDYLNVNANNATVSVYNGVGQKLYEQRLTGNKTNINRNFATGVYVVKVNNGVGSVSNKVIVE